jgi:hypothetical protein
MTTHLPLRAPCLVLVFAGLDLIVEGLGFVAGCGTGICVSPRIGCRGLG